MTQPVLLQALSVSRPVWERAGKGPPDLRVMGASARACILAGEGGLVVELVTRDVGEGPLNVVLARGSVAWPPVGSHGCLQDGGVSAEGLRVTWDRAVVWEPVPDWTALRKGEPGVEPLRQAFSAPPPGPGGEPWPAGAREDLRAGWDGDQEASRRAARCLAGRGPGLTPAGDDVLCGAMLRAHLHHPDPAPFCAALSRTAAPRTTGLSAAFLHAAARGECAAPWHRLLQALASRDARAITAACAETRAHGATSGADMILGFLGVKPA